MFTNQRSNKQKIRFATCVNNETKNKLKEQELHKRKDDKFYELKREYRRTEKNISDLEVIVKDYQ